jgi:DNA polymerase elongation subunit (family B)
MSNEVFYVDDVNSAKDLSQYLANTEFLLEDHPEGKLVKTVEMTVIILPNYLKYVNFPAPKAQTTEDNLIYGKNHLERIVSIDTLDNGNRIVFIEHENGQIERREVPGLFWVLAPYGSKADGWRRLEGKQYYKWEKTFATAQDLSQFTRENWGNDTYKIANDKEAFMVREGYTYFKGMKHDEVSILSFDIETNGLTKDHNSRLVLIANTFRKNGKTIKKLFVYNEYENDGVMIEDWCKWVREVDPSIICGHNIIDFDIPYIEYIASLHDKLCHLGRDGSPWSMASKESKFRVDGSRDLHYKKVSVFGRSVVDTMFLAYRYDIGRQYDSYGLKYIINKEGLEKKDRVFYDASKIRDNYLDQVELEKIKLYAIDDGDDSLALYDKFSPISFYLSRSVPKPFQLITESASGSQINSMMVRAYYQLGFSIPKASDIVDLQGAISFAIPGIYNNVLKIDFAQLYPSIMMQYNVHDEYKDPDCFFPKMVRYFTEARKINKQKFQETGDIYYDYLQAVNKVTANSCYGFLSAKLNFNSPKSAAFITAKARELLRTSILWSTDKDADEWIQLFEERTKKKKKKGDTVEAT